MTQYKLWAKIEKKGKKMSQGIAINKSIAECVKSTAFDRIIDIYDMNNELSVVRLLQSNATFYRDKILSLDNSLRDQDQFTIRKLVKPSPTLNQLRLNFWTEYDRCLGASRGKTFTKLNMANVMQGVCSGALLREFFKDELQLAWILTPVQSYQSQAQDVMETAMYKMREGLENMDMTDIRELNTVIKIFEGFDKRLNGEYKKSIEITKKQEINTPDVKKQMTELGINNDVVVDYGKEE